MEEGNVKEEKRRGGEEGRGLTTRAPAPSRTPGPAYAQNRLNQASRKREGERRSVRSAAGRACVRRTWDIVAGTKLVESERKSQGSRRPRAASVVRVRRLEGMVLFDFGGFRSFFCLTLFLFLTLAFYMYVYIYISFPP